MIHTWRGIFNGPIQLNAALAPAVCKSTIKCSGGKTRAFQCTFLTIGLPTGADKSTAGACESRNGGGMGKRWGKEWVDQALEEGRIGGDHSKKLFLDLICLHGLVPVISLVHVRIDPLWLLGQSCSSSYSYC